MTRGEAEKGAEPKVSGADGAGGEAPDPHGHPSVWGPRLSRLIERQSELYEELLSLTEAQSSLIDREDEGDALIDLLRTRQGYVDEVAAHNEALEPFVSRWDELSAALDDETRAELSAAFGRLMGLIDRWVQRDEAGREAIAAQREKLGGELSDLSRNKSAVSSYARSGVTNPPRYQDRRA